MRIEKKARNIHVLYVEPKKRILTLQISDIHFDSPKCDRELLSKHLREAEKKGALVFINGDLYDAMGCLRDPRSNYSDIRPEYSVTNYIDSIVKDSIKFFSKFKVTYFIGRGNHETNIFNRQHTDITARLCEGLKAKGIEVHDGGYSGWFVYKLQYSKNGNRQSVKQFYHHGYGGNAPRSKGSLKIDINMKNHPDADIITTGHDHNKWFFPIAVQRLSNNFNLREETVYNIDTGSYKKLGDGFGGWATEKGFSNPSLGGWWVDIGLKDINRKAQRSIIKDIKIYEAK